MPKRASKLPPVVASLLQASSQFAAKGKVAVHRRMVQALMRKPGAKPTRAAALHAVANLEISNSILTATRRARRLRNMTSHM
jgi:hypothetical protein